MLIMLQEGDASFPSATELGGQPSQHPKQAAGHISAALNCPLYLTALQTLSKHYQKAGGKFPFFSLLSCLAPHSIQEKDEAALHVLLCSYAPCSPSKGSDLKSVKMNGGICVESQ